MRGSKASMLAAVAVVLLGVGTIRAEFPDEPTIATDGEMSEAELLQLLPPGGKTVGGPGIVRADPGRGHTIYFARFTPLTLCVSITQVEGNGYAEMKGAEPVALVIDAGESISGCRPGADEISVKCEADSPEPCVVVFRVDRP